MDLSPFEPFEGLEQPDAISFDFGPMSHAENDLSLFASGPLAASLGPVDAGIGSSAPDLGSDASDNSLEASHESSHSSENSHSDSSPGKRRKGARRAETGRGTGGSKAV